jgi:hypothetical protein
MVSRSLRSSAENGSSSSSSLGRTASRAGHGDALLLTAGQGQYGTLGKILHMHQRQRLADGGFDLVRRLSTGLQPERDVIGDVQMRKQCVVLKYHADIAFMRRYPGQVVAVE